MSDTVYDDVVVSESGYSMGEDNTFNNLTVNSGATLGNYSSNVVNGMTIEDEYTFVQFGAGTVSDVVMLGGKFEVFGATTITNIVVDGSLYSQEVGVTGDNNSETGFSSTQLVVFDSSSVVENLTLQNGGSAFIYNGATLDTATVNDGGVLYLTNWSLDADTVAYVNDITVYGGGTLWLGSGSEITGTISTYADSTIIWDASAGDVTLDYIILRGTDIDITEGLIINSVLQGGAQTVDGGYVGTWTNNYGTFTMYSGTVDSYIQNNSNSESVVTIYGGTVNSLDLSTNGAINYIYGGTVDNITINAGWLRIWTDSDDVVTNLTIDGADLVWIGNYDSDITDSTVTGVELISGTIRIDGIVEDMTVTGGLISLAGGTIDGLDMTGGTLVNWTSYTGYISNAVIDGGDISSAGNIVWTNVELTNTTLSTTASEWYNVTLNTRTDDVSYYTFADGSTIDGLYSENNVSLGSSTTASNIIMNAGAIVGYGSGTTVDGLTLQGSGWAQFMAGDVYNVTVTGETKFEAWYGARLYNVVVDADGVDVEMGETKVGADLVVLYSAEAENVTLQNGGSAHVYESATITNVTATDGGVLYMTNWDLDAGTTGNAYDVYITSTGGFYYNLGAGEIDGLTIEAGANVVMNISTDTDISGTYISGIDGIGDIDFDNLKWVSIVFENSTLYGNYTTGYTNALDYDELYVFEGGSLYGINLNTSYVEEGYYIASDGTISTFSMGSKNSYGGYHSEGVYFYNGLAVLGSGSAGTDSVSVYNTTDGLTFDASTFVVGNFTISTDLTFINGSTLQTYSNSEIYLTNLDVSEDSIYRTGSIVDGVVSNIIFENGGFVSLYAADFSYTGSAAGHAQDIMLVGKTDESIGNYSTANMTTFGGYSYLSMQTGTTADGVYVSEYCTIYSTASDITATNVTLETYGNLYLTAVSADTAVSGTKDGVEFSIADGVITNLTMDSSNAYIGTSIGIAYENLTYTAGYLCIAGDTTFSGTTYIGADFYSVADDATVTYSGDVTFDGLETTSISNADDVSGLTSLTIIGGVLDVYVSTDYALVADITITDVTSGYFQARLGEGSSLVIDNSTFVLEPTWYNYECDITVTNASSVNWWGDGMATGTTLTLSGDSAVAVNISGITLANVVIEDSSTLTINSTVAVGSITVNSTSSYGVLGYAGFSYDDMTINTGKVILEAGTYTGDITVIGDGVTSTYLALYGDLAEGTIEVTGSGTAYIGYYGGSAGSTAEAIVVSTGVAGTGVVYLRSGSVGGLDIDGGYLAYEAGFGITGDVSLSNTSVNGLSLSGEATSSMDLTSVDSFTIGNNVTVNLSIDASNSYNVSIGANLSIADGVTITVGSLTAIDLTGADDYTVSGLDQIVGTVSISTITTGIEDVYSITIGDADYLNFADGVVVDGVTITAADTAVVSGDYSYLITVDADTNVAVVTKEAYVPWDGVYRGDMVITNTDDTVTITTDTVFEDLTSLTIIGGTIAIDVNTAYELTADITLQDITSGSFRTRLGEGASLTIDNSTFTLEPTWYKYNCDITVTNGSAVNWWGDGISEGNTLTISGGSTVTVNISSITFDDIVVEDSSVLTISGSSITTGSITVNSTSGYAVLGYAGFTYDDMTINTGKVILEAGTYTGDITVVGDGVTSTYLALYGDLAEGSTIEVTGAGTAYIGYYGGSAGSTAEALVVSTGVAGTGVVYLRNGSVGGLDIDGGSVSYEAGFAITGDVSLSNTSINGLSLSGSATTSMDLTSVSSFTIGNNVTANISIDASNSYDVSVGANLSIADGMTITVGSLTAIDLTGTEDYTTISVSGLDQVVGDVSISTITTGTTDSYTITLCDADYLNWADGIVVDGITITEANVGVTYNYYTYTITVDEDTNIATLSKSTDYNVWTGEVVIENADSSIAFDSSDVFVDLISLTVNGGEFSLEYADTFTGDIYLNSVTGWIKTTMGAGTTLTLDGCVITFEPRWYTWQGDVNVVNGTSLYWWGDSMASGTTLTIDNATVYLRTSASFGDIVVTNSGYLNSSYGDYLKADSLTVQDNGQAYITGCTVGEIVLNDGWVQFDGEANTHTANVTVDATEGDWTYVSVIGTLAGNLDVAGYGYAFVGSYDWGAGYVTGVASISSGVAGVGYLTLRNGSVAGLSVDGGTVTYEQYDAETGKGVLIYGDVSFANTIITGSSLSGEATTSMDLTSVDSLTFGNNVTTNISIDASNSYDITVGAFLSVADGMTITVGSITAIDISGIADWFTVEVTGLDSVEGTISIDSITYSSAEVCLSLGSADYLNWEDGISIKGLVTITEANVEYVVSSTVYMISVDEDNNATLTVFRESSSDKEYANWPEGWSGPTFVIPITAEDVERDAVDGVFAVQEAGDNSSQVRFYYYDPNLLGGINTAYISSTCNDLTVIMGQTVTFAWGGRAATYAEVTDVQNLTIFGGGTCISTTLTNSSNIYIYGEDTTTTAVFGGGLRDFTAEEGSTYYQVTEANIYIEDGTHALVAGGGYGADIVNDVNIDAVGAEFTGLVTGGGMGNVGGDVNISMTDVTGTANIFGGATCSTTAYLYGDAALAESVTVAGDVNMSLADSNITGMVFGGGSASGDGIASTVAGDVNISFSNTTQENNVVYTGVYTSAWIVGGGQAVSGATAEVAGTVYISVTDSTVGNIVGGGQATGTDSYSVVAATDITIAGSTVTSNVFGGGYSDGVGTSVVTGDVSITIDATTDTSILGDIYAGGSGTTSIVYGDAEVTFTGSADALSFTGTVYGEGNYNVVYGTSTISFASFTGSFAAAVVDFDVLSLSADTAMSFETTISVTSISFDLSDRTDTSVAFVDATNIDSSLDSIELSGIADVSEDSVFTLATSVSDSLVEDAMFSILDDDSIEIGTFTFGEELVIEGVGTYLASLTDGVLTIEFNKELDDTDTSLLA